MQERTDGVQELHVRPASSEATREANPKKAPDLKSLGWTGSYAPSPDGLDANLLLLLHGLGPRCRLRSS